MIYDRTSFIAIDASENCTNTKLIVNGRDVLKELDIMRDALLLLQRNLNMESKYPRLKEIKEEYEQEMKKYETFEALK